MKAFQENIGALEKKIKIFIQKWKEVQVENELLIERNKQLEEKLAGLNQGKRSAKKAVTASQNSDNNYDYSLIVKSLDGYIEKVDHCIVKLNKELDG